jgi:glycerol-3-phosphate acyltransferase PlsY
MLENVAALAHEIAHIEYSRILLTACVLVAYLAGTISPAIILGKIYGIDIRGSGSGNAGTTNVLRVIGKKAAVITLLVDVSKGFVVVALAKPFAGGAFAMLCGIAVLCGHIWPLFYGFRGGKGVAAALGVILAFDFRMGFALLGVALILILLFRRVSVGALIAAAAFPAFVYAVYPVYFALSLPMAAIIWFKHRQNIRRILRGEEPKLRFKK